MSSLFQMRQIKMRTLEDAVYTTQYNRARFDITADDMSTDLSQSYLLLRLILTNGQFSSEEVSTETLLDWLGQNVCVSFGKDEASYSPACLIKTARLISKKTGQAIEEIQFANVLSQYLFQMCNDKETLAAQNLMTGTALEIGKGSGITQAYSSFIPSVPNPQDVTLPPNTFTVRILLKEIFACCNTSNFWLTETAGLQLSFELEDRLPILKTGVIAQPERINFVGQAPMPGNYPEGLGLESYYDQYPETMGAKPYSDNIFNEPTPNSIYFDPGTYTEIINAPKAGWKYMADYFVPITWLDGGDAVTTITLAAPNSAGADLINLGFVAGNVMKINFAYSGLTQAQIDDVNGGVGVQPKIMEYISEITSVVNGGAETGAVITLTTPMYYPAEWITEANLQAPYISSIEILPSTFAYLTSVSNAANALFTTAGGLLVDNKLTLTTEDLQFLTLLGIVYITAGDYTTPTAFATTNASFELAFQSLGATAQLVIPDVIQYQDTPFSTLSSNGLVRVPEQGRACRIQNVTAGAAAGTWNVKFSDLGINTQTGWNGQSVVQAAYSTLDPVYTFATPATVFPLFFNVMSAGALPAASADPPSSTLARENPWDVDSLAIPTVLGYKIDRFEIVLVQQTKNPKMPMSMGCSTWRVEPSTIQYPQYQWSQQFYVSEPNCYNCVLLTPNYSVANKLLSESRNIARYRNSINNIDTCNRDTVISSNESDYPSSLYNDQLVSYFGNTQYPMRTLYGLREIAHSENPVISVPIKVYNAFANGMMLGNGDTSYTVQVNLYGDPAMSRTISTGAVFFYKQCLKSWNSTVL